MKDTPSPRRDVAPALHPLPPVGVAPARTDTLAGGARLLTIEAGDQPVARLLLLWDGGPHDASSPAVAQVMSEALLEGTATMSADYIADSIDYEGASIRARFQMHNVGLSLMGLSDNLEALLPIVRSLIAEPLLGAAQIETPARRMAAAETVEQAKVAVRAGRAALAMVTGQGHRGTRVATPADFLAVTPEMARDFHRHTLGRGTAGLQVILGGRVSDRLRRAVIDMVESLPCSGAPSLVQIQPFHPEPARRVDLAAPEAVQSAVALAMPAPGRDDPDYIPLRMAITALGGYFGSRLNREIREQRGLTYGISASLLGTRDGAMVKISAQCSPDKVDEVIDETLAQVRGLWEHPLEPDEIERLRLSSWSALAAQVNSPLSTVDYYASRILVGTPADYFERQMEAIRGITAARLADVARRHLAAPWAIATCGPA